MTDIRPQTQGVPVQVRQSSHHRQNLKPSLAPSTKVIGPDDRNEVESSIVVAIRSPTGSEVLPTYRRNRTFANPILQQTTVILSYENLGVTNLQKQSVTTTILSEKNTVAIALHQMK